MTYRPAPQTGAHIAPRCDLQQGTAGGASVLRIHRSSPGNLDFHFPNADVPRASRQTYAYFSRLLENVL